ncbi:MAG TPA: hypothetical protein VII70_08070 [Steroidobacteraceae bacterium]
MLSTSGKIMHKVNAGCHCGNIGVELELAHAPGNYSPRTCDCEFCKKHGAAYVSDPRGTLDVTVEDEQACTTYRQGSALADFLICKRCGVLVGVFYRDEDRIYAALNASIVGMQARFGAASPGAPKKLTDIEKVARWKALWFSEVRIAGADG